MEAPDKIFMPNELLSEEWQRHIEGEDTAYIRKDALLEWLKMAIKHYSHPDTVNVVDMIRCEGKKWAFQDVINKIESL